MTLRIYLTISTLAMLFYPSCNPEDIASNFVSTKQNVVYGDDDRKEYYDSTTSAGLRAITSDSTAAFIWDYEIVFDDPQNIQFVPSELGDRTDLRGCPGKKLCTDQRFVNQPVAAYCTGTLIDDDLMLTAGHCFPAGGNICDHASWVFNYFYVSDGVLETIKLDDVNKDVYRCEREIVKRYEKCGVDYAIVKLASRPTDFGYTPALVNTSDVALSDDEVVYTVSFPNGIPAKLDEGGKVISGRPETMDYFEATLDVFVHSSGCGVYDTQHKLVGIGVRAPDGYEEQSDCCVAHERPASGYLDYGCGLLNWKADAVTYVSRAIDDLCSTEPSASFRLCADECTSGICCDTAEGRLRPPSYRCDTDTELNCAFGLQCGSDVGERKRYRYCDGVSDTCQSTWSTWSNWTPAIQCPGSERCSDVGGDAHCYADPACSCECSFGSGPCCDGCSIRPSTYKCAEDVSEEYICPEGTSCGGEVFVRRLDRYCSGNSTQCNGMEAWDTPAVIDDCDQASRCQPGNPICYVDPFCGGHPPELRSGDVDPSSGYGSDTFHFTVDFKDADNDAPTKADLVIVRPVIGNLRVGMDKVGVAPHSQWNEYSADVLGGDIGLGTWSYFFEFESDGGTARRPTSGEFIGPSVMDIDPHVQITEPMSSVIVPGGGSVHVEWITTGCTSVSLAHTPTRDVPPTPGAGTTIASGLAPVGSHDWSIGSLADGTYWILAECYNVTGAWTWHYGGPVTVSDIYISDRAWYPPEDLSTTGSYPDLAVGSDGTVHVVWRSGNAFYSQRSPDGVWSPPAIISSLGAGGSLYRGPRIAIDGDDDVHVAYAVESPVLDTRYVGLDSTGNITNSERIIHSGGGVSISGIAVDGSGRVHVSYVDDADASYVYWSRSVNGGVSFSPAAVLGSGVGQNFYFTGKGGIAASGNSVHVVAQYDDREGSGDVVLHYFNSSTGGDSWSGSTTLTSGTGNGIRAPEISAEGSRVHVFYDDGRSQSLNQLYMWSGNGGANWSTPTEIPVPDTEWGDIATFGSQVLAITIDSGGHFTESPDSTSWAAAHTLHPDLTAAEMDSGPDGRVHVIGTITGGNIVYIASRPPQVCPSITVLEPDGSGIHCYPGCSISWVGTDEDGDTLSVRISYDTDQDPASMTGINGAEGLPGSGTYALDTSSMPSGSYWVYLEITDGICTKGFYSDAQIIVDRPPSITLNTPPLGDARAYPSYLLEWEAADPEGGALDISIKWADMDFPEEYHLVAEALPDIGEYVWDLTGFEHGKVLNLVAIVSDRVNSSIVAFAPGQLIIHHPEMACVFDSDCPASNLCSDGYCVCIPDCSNRECGLDPVCGQTCGTCTVSDICLPSGQCCTPDCTGRECGSDSCGGSCGTCPPEREFCSSSGLCVECFSSADCDPDHYCDLTINECVCAQDCTGIECGPDPICGESCGVCQGGWVCNLGSCTEECNDTCSTLGCNCGVVCGEECGSCGDGWICENGCLCVEDPCIPDCTGLECGLDPVCGQSCGTCTGGEVCNLGECVPPCTDTCSDLGCDCGTVCGESCGTCESGWTCTDGCRCVEDDCSQDCTGLECGPDPVCGASCGDCPAGAVCDRGACVSDCTETCESAGCICGLVCGEPCGACVDPWRCTNGCDCECIPQCEGKECGDDQCFGTCGDCQADLECVDGSCQEPDCQDADGDGYENHVCGGTDCNDSDFQIKPDQLERCGDAIDNNCNGFIDEGCQSPSTGGECGCSGSKGRVSGLLLFAILGLLRRRKGVSSY